MSDLDPLLHDSSFEDPSVTRLLVRHPGLGRAGSMLDSMSAVATSVSIIISESGPLGEVHLESTTGWRPAGVRVEMLVLECPTDPGRLALRDALSRTRRSWRVLERPLGGRASAIAAAIEQSEHEFVIVSTHGAGPFELVTPALSHMWVEGADVALLQWETESSGGHAADRADAPPPVSADPVGDAARELAEWLGVSGVSVPGRLVVMRRWVARWLFNEISRAIDPAEELADRARLLGIGIVQMIEPAPPGAIRDDH
ncbi:hypothetical protein BH10ACT3_BH10ACT3_04030 [soil metagenome]